MEKLILLFVLFLSCSFTYATFAADYKCGGEVRLLNGVAKNIEGKSSWGQDNAKQDFIDKCTKFLKKKKNIMFAPTSYSFDARNGHLAFCRGLARSYCRD